MKVPLSVEACVQLGGDVAAEGCEAVRARVPRRHAGGSALIGDELVGGDANRRGVGIDVRVQVVEPGNDELSRRVEHAVSALGWYVSLERLNSPKRMPMSRLARSDWLGSTTSPPLMRRSNLSHAPIVA